jgi:hypothetical protein
MLKIFRKFWDVILTFFTYLGILYGPADLFGLPQTYPVLGQVADMLDRFTLLAIFSGILVVYILWIDLRPLIRSRMGRDVKDCLRVGEFHIAMGGIHNGSNVFQLKFNIHNDSSDKPLYFIMKNSDLSIDSRVNDEAEIQMSVTRMQSCGRAEISLAAIDGLERKQMYSGKVKLGFEYGPTSNNLKFQLYETAVLTIQIDEIDETNYKYAIEVSHRSVKHKTLTQR